MQKIKKSRSLKRKIQNAIFRSTLLSQVLFACILIPTLLITLVPIGQIMTRGVAVEIAQRYAYGGNNKLSQEEINMHSIKNTSEAQLIENIKKQNLSSNTNAQKDADLDDAILISENFFKMPILSVDSKTEDLKKLIVISSQQYENANQFINENVVPIKLYTLNFKAQDYAFYLPDEKVSRTLPEQNFIEKYVSATSSEMTITDENNIPIGILTIGINPNVVSFLVVPYIILMTFVSLGSLLLISLVGKFMTAGILKPVDILNKKLSAMAKGDLENFPDHPISMQKAPTEINQLINSSNEILLRMTEGRHQLEAQNEELQSQNDELLQSKSIIQKQQNMLVQTEKMASVGQLSAAIVHEINTPVGAIKSNAQMIEMLYGQLNNQALTEPQQKTLSKIKGLNDIVLQASEQVISIIRSLKSYSRLDQSDFIASDLNEDLKNVLVLTSNLWKNNIKVEENYGDIPMVKCYSGLLNQVFMNLVVNAIDAMEDGGKLTLTTSSDAEWVQISITDTGTGIAPENLTKIFEEGFTTKSKNKGSGLGLALSHDVVIRHKGRIDVQSQFGIGSTFTVVLPIKTELT